MVRKRRHEFGDHLAQWRKDFAEWKVSVGLAGSVLERGGSVVNSKDCAHVYQANSQMYVAETQAAAMMGRTDEIEAPEAFATCNYSVFFYCDFAGTHKGHLTPETRIVLHGAACVFSAMQNIFVYELRAHHVGVSYCSQV